MNDDLSQVRQGDDRWAPHYDHDLNPMQGMEQSHIQPALGELLAKRLIRLLL
ncbi:hypothetical protein [Blastopirellula retiformator]|uniref:Uncharacterized protein n=1 Tax=Blastopirellula retiformator TaxID=2527970 RepID=A0A5C5UZ07_9BACT|nr:hypothetical protein [Blastopirellula retiformator]TWT31368.1 hypothetical protein Enr8_32890 [Blastopirellula retiformator]